MSNNLKEKAKTYFEEEMSGEPLHQDVVIDGIVDFTLQQITNYEEWRKATIIVGFDTDERIEMFIKNGDL